MTDEDATPPRGVVLDDDSRYLADLFFAFNGAASRIGEAAAVVAGLRGAERTAFLEALANKLTELGDHSHEARRELQRRARDVKP